LDWNAQLTATNHNLDAFRQLHPEASKGYTLLHHATMKPGALGQKEKEMIAIAIGITSHCSDCIGFHMRSALRAGMTRVELAEVIGVSMAMGGGPAYMYGAMAIEAFDQLSVA